MTQGQRVANWRQIAAGGERIGGIAAPVVVVEFADFQCPACAVLHQRLLTIAKRYPKDVAVVYRHYPLISIHPHAYAAALAAECAAAQGRFTAVRDALFTQQDSIGVRSWEALAHVAKLPDPPGFARCVENRHFASRVDEDVAVGRALDVRGTPVLLVNDRRFDGALPLDVLDSIIHVQFRRSISVTLSADR